MTKDETDGVGSSEGIERHEFQNKHSVGSEAVARARRSRANERAAASAAPQISRSSRSYRRTRVPEQRAGQVR